MNKRALFIGLIGILVALVLTITAAAQTSTGYDLSWSALAGGGAQTSSTGYSLNSTLGQWVAGPVEAASVAMNSGYWQPWQDQMICLPLILR